MWTIAERVGELFFFVFLACIVWCGVSAAEHQLFPLPSCYGGLGVSNPLTIANVCLDSSVCSTEFLRDCILDF